MSTPSQNPVGWFEIYVQDMARAKAFYAAVFETTLTDTPAEGGDMEMAMFAATEGGYGCGGALVKHADCPSGPGGTLVYFMCADAAVTADRVVAHGGKICKPKFSIGQHGFIAIAQDTEGNVIGLHSMV